MNLTPIDVEQKAFTQALRGYQMDEVDDFLDEIVGTLRGYEQRLREAQDKIRVLETEGTSPKQSGDESEISRAILTAQRSADRLLDEARTEADTIRRDAAAEASRLSARRDSERQRLQSEVASMSDRVASLRTSLTDLTNAVGSEVDKMDTEISQARSGLGEHGDLAASEGKSEEELLDDFDAMSPDDEVDGPGDQTVQEEMAPSFSDIFPESDNAPSEAQEAESRVTSRPWERG